MSDHEEPPPEPFNPKGRRQPFWAITNPWALGATGVALIVLGGFFLQQAWAGFSLDPVGNVVAGTLGLALVAFGLFSVHVARRRARWYQEMTAWEERTGRPPSDE